MSKYSDMERMTRATAALVADPRGGSLGGGCWGRVDLHTGQRAGPSWTPCSKAPRPGHLTCWWHQDRETEAQELKARIDAKGKT